MLPESPRDLLRPQKLRFLLVSDLTNIRYLSGLPVSAGYALVTQKRVFLFVDARYKDLALRSAKNVTVRDIGKLASVMAEIKECGFEADDVTISRFRRWQKKFPNTKFVRTTGIIEDCRRQKDREELRHLKRAHRMTQELLRRVPSTLKRNITEEKLARQLLMWALEMGADGLSFEPIVAFGTHTSSPHHKPTSRPLQKGNLVQIDVGVKFKGYCADMSEVFFTARPTKLQKRIYNTLVEAKDAAMNAVEPGASTHRLDEIAREILDREGLEEYFTHALGHGVGLDIHEGASISGKAPDMELLKNEVITIEPGVYFPGKFGMRVEDMIYV